MSICYNQQPKQKKRGTTIKLYHGTDNPNFKLHPIKKGTGYHPGAGPVEFLGSSLTGSREVASSYGNNIIETEFVPNKAKKFSSLKSLKNNIIKVFGLPTSGQNLGEYYRDIADSYKAKLLVEGFDSVIFPEGLKASTNEKVAITVIPLSEDFYNHPKTLDRTQLVNLKLTAEQEGI